MESTSLRTWPFLEDLENSYLALHRLLGIAELVVTEGRLRYLPRRHCVLAGFSRLNSTMVIESLKRGKQL
jgi:hypothetical protein